MPGLKKKFWWLHGPIEYTGDPSTVIGPIVAPLMHLGCHCLQGFINCLVFLVLVSNYYLDPS